MMTLKIAALGILVVFLFLMLSFVLFMLVMCCKYAMLSDDITQIEAIRSWLGHSNRRQLGYNLLNQRSCRKDPWKDLAMV